MKLFKHLLFAGLAFVLVLNSCTVEKRVYTKGYHFEWLKGKNSAAKQNDMNADKQIAENQIVTPQSAAPVTSDNAAVQAESDNSNIASADNSPAVLSGIPASVQKSSTSSERISSSENSEMVKPAVKKAKEDKMPGPQGSGKKWLIALILCFFLGGMGIHRFYLGYTWQGIVQLLTGGGCGVWALIDFIRIIIRDLGPKDGDYVD